MHPGRHQATTASSKKSFVLDHDAQVSHSDRLGQDVLTSSMPESSSNCYEPRPSNKSYGCTATQQQPTLTHNTASASAQARHSKRMHAYTRDEDQSELDEEEEPVSSHGVFVNHAARLRMIACTTPQMRKAAMAGIKRCSWLPSGSMMHAARAATADLSAAGWNFLKVMVHKLQ